MHLRALHTIRHQSIAAFSLIEIVIALGIVSFALVGILGLFPVAIEAATNSQRETQAALIARSIFSDLEAQSGKKRFILLGKDETSSSDENSGQTSKRFAEMKYKNVDLIPSSSTSYYLGYDADGLPIEPSDHSAFTAGEYSNGYAGAGFLAKVTVTPPVASAAGITQVEVTVTAPAAAAETKRSAYPFVSLLDNGQ